MAGDGLPDIEDAGDIGAHQPLEGIGRKVLQRAAVLHAGIVDEDVDGAGLRLEAIHGLAGSGMVGGVEGERVGSAEFGSGGGEFRRIATVEDDLGAGGLQALGQRKADALRGAGDEGAFAGEVEEGNAHDNISVGRALNLERFGSPSKDETAPRFGIALAAFAAQAKAICVFMDCVLSEAISKA